MSDDASWPTQTDGETYVAKQDYGTAGTSTPVKRKGRTGTHLNSLVLSLLLTPIALVLVDYALVNGWGRNLTGGVDEPIALRAGIALGVAAALLLVVGAMTRASGLGPLVAGLVWGAAPAVGFALVPLEMTRRMADLPNLYDNFLEGLSGPASILFAVLGAVLVGAGLFGRWRNPKPVARTVVQPAPPVDRPVDQSPHDVQGV
jgi:hypothetical protein